MRSATSAGRREGVSGSRALCGKMPSEGPMPRNTKSTSGRRREGRRSMTRKQQPSQPRISLPSATQSAVSDTSIKWGRGRQKTLDVLRQMRRAEALTREDFVVRLDQHEAAEYLGIPVRKFRTLVEKGVLRFHPGTRLFDIDELEAHMLGGTTDPAEQRKMLLRRVRWEAHDLEKYPISARTDLADAFSKVWGQLAQKFEEGGHDDEAAAVRTIIKQAYDRSREVTSPN